MASKKQRRFRRRFQWEPSRHKGSMKVIAAILLILCGSMGVHTWQIHRQTEEYALMEESLKQQIADEQENQKAIEAQAEYQNSNAYIEALAREKLGLIYENEIIFKKRGR